MQPGFIEAVSRGEVTERKEFWREQLEKADLSDRYEVVAREMPGITVSIYLGIFVEEKPNGKAQAELAFRSFCRSRKSVRSATSLRAFASMMPSRARSVGLKPRTERH